MTVEAIRLENFMAFADTGWIELRPICLLFGRNSSGKSAIIRALRFLKQSLDTPPNSSPLVFLAEDGVDLGTFKETVHQQFLGNPITFHFRCTLSEILRNALHKSAGIAVKDFQNRVDLSLGFVWDTEARWVELIALHINLPRLAKEEQNESLKILWAERSFKYEIEQPGEEDEKLITHIGEVWEFDSDLLHGHELDDEPIWTKVYIELTSGFLPTVLAPSHVLPNHYASGEDFTLVNNLLAELHESIKKFLQSIEYIGPLRPEPQRVYALDGLTHLRWEKRGLKAFLDFISGRADRINQDQIIEIENWLAPLGLGEKINVNKPSSTWGLEILSQVKLHESEKGLWVSLRDIGFGASQVLPVVIQSVSALPGSLVIIEQPELHLHPRSQADLADVFIKQIYKLPKDHELEDKNDIKEYIRNIKDSGVRFLIETHSVNLITRLRRRLAETARDKQHKRPDKYFNADGLAAYFIDRINAIGLSVSERIEYDQTGAYKKQPEKFIDFFGNDYHELRAMNDARREALRKDGK